MRNGSYCRLVSNSSSSIYKIDSLQDINEVLKVVGEGNTTIPDDYSLVVGHDNNGYLCATHNSGPAFIKIYTDGKKNYYVYIPAWGYAIVYFANRISINSIISTTKVDIDISTLTQVGIL